MPWPLDQSLPARIPSVRRRPSMRKCLWLSEPTRPQRLPGSSLWSKYRPSSRRPRKSPEFPRCWRLWSEHSIR